MATAVEVDLVANDRASDKLRRFGSAAGDASGKLGGFGTVVGGVFSANMLTRVVDWSLRAGAAVVSFAGDSITAASDLNETLNKNSVIFGEHAKRMETWAEGAAKNLGLSKQAALDSASGFGNMFTQLGVGEGKAAKLSESVVQMAADLGSFNNLPTAEVSDMMSAAFRGEYDSLQRLIPNINAARVEKEALAATGKKSASELTAQEKAMATLTIVTRDGKDAVGDFAETSDSLANQQKIAAAQMENLKATIGQKLLPVAVKVAQWFNDDFIPAAQRAWEWMSTKLGPVFEWVASKMGPLRDKLKGAFEDAAPFMTVVGEIMENVVVPVFKFLGEVVMEHLINQIEIMGKVFGVVGDVYIWVWNNVLQPTFKGFTKAIAVVLEALADMLDALDIPGAPAWIGETADKLHTAADGAEELSNAINDIPDRKAVTIAVNTVGMSGFNQDRVDRAGGADGGAGVLRQPRSPRGSVGGDAGTSPRQLRRAMDGMKITLTGGGQNAYLMTGAN